MIDEEHAVGVAVVRKAEVGTRARHELAKRLQMRGAALHVDVATVVVGVDGMHRGTQTLERHRRGRARSAVTAVDGHHEPLERHAVERLDRMVDIALAGVLHLDDMTHALTGRELIGGERLVGHDPSRDLLLERVGELHALGREELDAVELGRIVRGRYDDAAVELGLHREQRHGRRGDDAAAVRTAALGHDARRERTLEHGAREARVAAHADVGTQELGCGAPEPKGEVAVEVGVRHAAHAIGTEDVLRHCSTPCRYEPKKSGATEYSVDPAFDCFFERRKKLSAWRTGERGEPS